MACTQVIHPPTFQPQSGEIFVAFERINGLEVQRTVNILRCAAPPRQNLINHSYKYYGALPLFKPLLVVSNLCAAIDFYSLEGLAPDKA